MGVKADRKARRRARQEQAAPAASPGQGTARAVPVWLTALLLATPLVIVLAYGTLTTPAAKLFSSGQAAPRAVGPSAFRAPPAGPQQAPAGNAAAAAPGAAEAQLPADIDRMVERLAKRLEAQPDDAKGWTTLAHTYYVMKRFPEAVKAYESLLKIGKADADAFADYADALAMAQGRSLGGKPMELVREALKLDPTHWKARSMAATEAFNRKDFAAAIEHWERALSAVPPGSELARGLQGNIDEARKLSAGK